MPLLDAEAIVLRHYSLSEADKIIVFLTREFGKLRATAQGVKRPRSRLAGSLEVLNHVRVQAYAKEGSDLSRIRQVEILHSYLSKDPSLEKLYAFSYLAELVQEFAEEGNPNQLIFRLFLATLNAGERLGVDEALVRYFELWMLRLNGLLPNYDYCSCCGRYVKDEGFFAWIQAGQGRCRACAGGKGLRIEPESAAVLHSIFELSPERLTAAVTSGPAVRGLEPLTLRLLELHLEKQTKSYNPLREILRNKKA